MTIFGIKKVVDAFNSIPDLNEEERLIRMDNFCTAQMARVKEMKDGPSKEKEVVRLGKVQAGIQKQRAKFEGAELRRVGTTRYCPPRHRHACLTLVIFF